MPHFGYQFHAAQGNCAPVLPAMAGPGNPAPRLTGLANTAGAALVLGGGIPAAGLGAVAALAACAPYTWAALNNAALRIGLYPAGIHPAYEATWRLSTLRVACYTAAGGRLARTPILVSLDAGEKRALSYFAGVSLAVYTAGVTGFTFPRHLSRHAAAYGGAGVGYALNPAAPFNAANLPDIIFLNPGAGTCQVWEAKGRGVGAAGGGFAAGGVAAVLNGAVDQTRKLATVLIPGGVLTAPNARIASVARINPADGRWILHVADPGQKRRREEGDPVGRAQFYEEFYRPFVEMVLDSRTTVDAGGQQFVVAPIRGTQTLVGLDERIVDLFRQGVNRRRRGDTSYTGAAPEEVADRIEQYLADGYPQDPDDDSRYISPEGILSQTTEEDLTR